MSSLSFLKVIVLDKAENYVNSVYLKNNLIIKKFGIF